MNESELYSKIPKSQCKKGCYKCCTNMIQFTTAELNAMGGYAYNGVCSHLIDGMCSIYEQRPFVCRIFGTSEIMKCENCVPSRYLNEEETKLLVHEYVLMKQREEAEKNV